MIVCVCAAKNEKDIHEACERGCRTLEDLADQLNVCTRCKRCEQVAQEIIQQYETRD